MKEALLTIVAGLIVTAAMRPTPVAAHHSFAAIYDQNQPIHVEGIVDRLEWKNPHVLITMTSAPANAGAVAHWVFEMGAPPVLMREFGWSPDTVKVGDHITIDGYAARAGEGQAAAWTVTTRTGARLRAVRPFR
jgi:hypothetical protein